ncbi:unnamed protein product [Spirodela intermedia]|uniref:Uncharacterized protein n=1 Tax=Spirodela intermedia TaxID=51605 RepID=A0A7I8L6U5_SPIIN|nr:unnamed protein product [Spirodela intermedia]
MDRSLFSSNSLLLLLLVMMMASPLLLPFHPGDLLPLLPWQVSRPLLGRLRNPADLVPAFVGRATASPNASLEWKGPCFRRNLAWVEPHNDSASVFGGGKLHIKTSMPCRWTCLDLYILATPYRVTWTFFFFSRKHTIDFNEWQGEAEYDYVRKYGVSIFKMEAGMLGTLRALSDVFSLFTDTRWGEKRNMEFLKKRMGASFEPRRQPWAAEIDPTKLHSGDLFVLSKLRGRWGGFETLEKWVTGSYAGHSAVCLRDSEGKLWIGESGHEVSEGLDLIAVLPWEEWWEFEVKRDGSDPHIALLPLHPEMRAKFNEAAAWEYARSMEGKPYGYHNMIFSWIDTVDSNFPLPADPNLVASFMAVWNHLQPDYAPILWDEALNKRLGTQGLSFPEIMVEVERRRGGMSFAELLAVPERDEWVYSDGPSASCIAFVIGMYKAAGLFGPIASSIHVTEFTIKDAYSLKFFEDNSSRLPGWCEEAAAAPPFCQVLGKYRMEFPGYNSVLPYAHMNERCPTLPPDYRRPLDC